jgi:hypothetical protein
MVAMLNKDQILKELSLFKLRNGGLGTWINEDTDPEVFSRLGNIDSAPISKVQLNQLLAFGHEAPVTDGFFEYYWRKAPAEHPYDVKSLPGYSAQWDTVVSIVSLEQLKWGLYRIFTDSLLHFGNVRTGFRHLRTLEFSGLQNFFQKYRFPTETIAQRGPALPLIQIAKDDRYLIAEMACKSYGEVGSKGDLEKALIDAFRAHKRSGGESVTIKELLDGHFDAGQNKERQVEFMFSADDVLNEYVATEQELSLKFDVVSQKFVRSRESALKNTRMYLSMVNDLDVYMATSMRSRKDFRDMADTCEEIFDDKRLKDLHLRHFDPTVSAAAGHEDKGLIECLMVKCAKALVYCAGDKDSYGKDAEAAMALSLGKPVIFYCDQEQKRRFFRDIHPLSRLIEFKTGVAVGAIATDSKKEVSTLLSRIFQNKMEYELEHPKQDYLRLKEKLTGSVIRLQTNDQMLSETFWNHYHNR